MHVLLFWVFFPAGPEVAQRRAGDAVAALRAVLVRQTASFFEFFLCLSGACLGKMIVYKYKWLENAVFRRCVENAYTEQFRWVQSYNPVRLI